MALANQVEGIRTVSGSTERDTLFPAPATGQKVYNSTTDSIEKWNGAQWVSVLSVARMIDVRNFGARGDGSTNDRAAIALADAAAVAVGAELLFAQGTHLISTSLTIASPVTISPGAVLKPANGAALTFAAQITARAVQAFDLSLGGTAVIGAVTEARPEWFRRAADTDDTNGVRDALASALTVLFSHKTYTVAGNGIIANIRSGQTLISHGATISHSTTVGITFNVADGVDDWMIIGRLNGLGAGNAIGTAVFLQILASVRYSVDTLHVKQISGWGVHIVGGTGSTPYGQGAFKVLDCNDCYVGFDNTATTTAEYTTIGIFRARSCTLAAKISAGNVQINGGHILRNVDGLWIEDGSNDGHGQIIGVAINHNTGFGVKVNAVELGQTFIGCHMYGFEETGGLSMISSKGLNWIGGIIDAPIVNTTPIGFSRILGAYIGGTQTVVTPDTDRLEIDVFGEDGFDLSAVDPQLSQLGDCVPADASGVALALTGASGRWERNKRQITARFAMTYPANADGSAAKISGLPIAAAGAGGANGVVSIGFCDASTVARGYLISTTEVVFYTSAGVAITNADLSGKSIEFEVTYRIA